MKANNPLTKGGLERLVELVAIIVGISVISVPIIFLQLAAYSQIFTTVGISILGSVGIEVKAPWRILSDKEKADFPADKKTPKTSALVRALSVIPVLATIFSKGR
jgi:hypothetical protein